MDNLKQKNPSKDNNMIRILIIGAGAAGKGLLKEVLSHKKLQINSLGFIDDDEKKIGKNILGIPVLGKIKELKKYIKELHIDKVFIALPSIDGSIFSDVLKSCIETGIPCQTIPRMREIIEGVDIRKIREVRIEDLLERPVRIHDVRDVYKLIHNSTILVTGAAGSIGSELCRQIALYKPKLIILYDWWENGLYEIGNEFKEFFPKTPHVLVIGNIQDKNRIDSIFKKNKPSLVFHTAAYKHVPLMEDNAVEAVKNNILGTKCLVEAAEKANVKKFVLISTDKAVEPKNVMGMTKLIGELIVSSANIKNKTSFFCVRFGNVLDSAGSVLPLFKKQIAKGEVLTVTDKNITRYFMTIPEAVQLILKATVLGTGDEVFILDMGKPVKIVDLAKKFILLSGLLPEKDIKIKFIGLRPGEKLKEELAAKGEHLVKTKFEKILMVKRNNIDNKKLEVLIKNLSKFCNLYDEKTTLLELKKFTQSV